MIFDLIDEILGGQIDVQAERVILEPPSWIGLTLFELGGASPPPSKDKVFEKESTCKP